MKKIKVFFAMAVALFLVGSVSANAQGKYGKDSAQCVNYLNFYKDYLKQFKATKSAGNLKEAANQWRGAFKTCPPKASQNLFVDGRSIYQNLIRGEKDAAVIQGMVDTIMLINKTRQENFAKSKAAVAENIAFDMLTYYGNSNPEKVVEAINNNIAVSGNKVKADLLVAYMQKASELYQAGKMSGESILKAYTDFSAIIDAQVAANPTEANKTKRGAFENAFVTSGVATCDNLVAVFTPRFEAEPTNVEVVKPIVSLLGSDSVCVNSDLFLKAVTALHQIEPSYTSSYFLYKLHASKDNADEAVKFLEEAIASEESDALKDGELTMELAVYNFKVGRHAKAVAAAKAAIEKDAAQGGKANLLMANIWAGQKCTAQDMDNRAKYWVAVDYLNKAKAADETLAEEVNKLSAQYRQYFPKTEDAFMYDLTDGKPYTISCGGMSATTTVRTTK
jgi:tetratricopeptide (TPR) repeat protein